MRNLERISYRNFLHSRLIPCGVFIILLFTLISKMNNINFSKLQNQAYIDHAVRILDNKEAVDYYFSVFQRLILEGYLRPSSKSLCISSTKDQEAVALKRIGVADVVGFSGAKIAPFSESGQSFHIPFGNNTFDFEFFGSCATEDSTDLWSVQPLKTASEVCRTLRSGGYLIVHIAIKDEYSFYSFLNLFTSCTLLKFTDIGRLNSSFSIRETVFSGKSEDDDPVSSYDSIERCKNKEKVPDYKRDLILRLEPVPEREPAEDWTEWGKYNEAINLFKYLPNLVDLRFKKRYIYIDLGARTYDSTIGEWFQKLYPKQDKEFEIYAIEADKGFHAEYENKKGVTLLPYAAWLKNETLVFGTRNKRKEYTGKIQQGQTETGMMDYAGEQNVVQAFDFAEWLMRSFSEKDFVVLKMDVEGTEMDLIPGLIETGAICLIDELFLECHYDRWVKCCSGKRTQRYNATYEQCFDLFSRLRNQCGSVVHQWW